MTRCPDSGPFSGLLDLTLDNLVPLDASPVSDPFLDEGEQERSDLGATKPVFIGGAWLVTAQV